MWFRTVVQWCIVVAAHGQLWGSNLKVLPNVGTLFKPETYKVSCKPSEQLVNGKCIKNVAQTTSDILDVLSVNSGANLGPVKGEGNITFNPLKFNVSTDLGLDFGDEGKNPEDGNKLGILDLPQRAGVMAECTQTVTTVNGKPACGGALLFDETFDSLNTTMWQRLSEFASGPDYEFVLYSDGDANSYVKDGRLFIKPTLAVDDKIDIQRGTHEVPRCTGRPGSDQCKVTVVGRSILAPVKTARLRTKNSFSFKYGRIEVQAKLPLGDWIFPEIWLEPNSNAYGVKRYESGLIQIALTRGNRNLLDDDKDIGARELNAGYAIGIGDVVHWEKFTKDGFRLWSEDVHTYGVTWTPEYISFSVDGKVIGNATPPAEGFKKLEDFSSLEVPWARGNKIAPFDQEFYISLGLSVGGFRLFPDGAVSEEHVKPWTNKKLSAAKTFWADKDTWHPTWARDSALQVEHVKVWAL